MTGHRIVSLFCMAAAVLLTGCSVTASLTPPFDKTAADSPRKYLGEWICSTKSDTYAISVYLHPKSDEALRIRIQQTPRDRKNHFRGTWIPLNGTVFRAGENTFLAVTADVEEMLREANRSEQAGWLLAPLFHVLKVTPENEGFQLQFVTFASPPESGTAWTPAEKSVQLHERIVLNSTGELQNFLKTGGYRLDKNVFHLVRREESGR